MQTVINEFLSTKKSREVNLLVIVLDLTNFTKFSKDRKSTEVFEKMKHFNTLTSEFVAAQNGLVIKFLGDACLNVFPTELASSAISAFIDFKFEMDDWLKTNMPGCQLAVNCHAGPVTLGPTPGYKGESQIDVIGSTVNTCFTMSNKGFVISPQAFRSLDKATRQKFKKYTPPIVYNLDHKS